MKSKTQCKAWESLPQEKARKAIEAIAEMTRKVALAAVIADDEKCFAAGLYHDNEADALRTALAALLELRGGSL